MRLGSGIEINCGKRDKNTENESDLFDEENCATSP